MLMFFMKRLLVSVPVLLGAVTVTFLILHAIPGDPAAVIAGTDASPEDIAALRERLELDQPLHTQFLRYIGRLIQGDLGTSTRLPRSVSAEIALRLPATLELAGAALLVATALGLLAGVVSAVKRNTWLDDVIMLIALTGISVPAFWLGLLFILLFSFQLGWLPVSGRPAPVWTAEGFPHIVLPALTLAVSPMAYIARLTRSGMLEVLNQDFVRTARSKGLVPSSVIFKHALRNAALPIITFIGMQAGMLLANAVVVETVFAWPGLSRLVATSIFARDLPMIQGSMLVLATAFVGINLLVDLSYGLLDPRITYA